MKQKFSEKFCVLGFFLGWRWHDYRLCEWSLDTTVVATSCTQWYFRSWKYRTCDQ